MNIGTCHKDSIFVTKWFIEFYIIVGSEIIYEKALIKFRFKIYFWQRENMNNFLKENSIKNGIKDALRSDKTV